mmetsp:Transcript_9884/g.30761  ORF Transcript_9884/g.30761 Transcript_9884/m.30761 type:complete len:165 (+) Transcript_9884:102-596(+)
MSLLVEPANKAACDRNEKERKLIHGLLKHKTREDYLLEHIGLSRSYQLLSPTNPASPSRPKQRRRAPSEGGTPLRAVASPLLAPRKPGTPTRMATPGGSSVPRSASAGSIPAARPASRGSISLASTEGHEPRLQTPPQDPLIQVMMKGPPLFSPNFATAAAAFC